MSPSHPLAGDESRTLTVADGRNVFSAESVIRTMRLRLIPATAQHVRAELDSLADFGALINADIPQSWPPGQYDRDAQEFFLQSLLAGGEEAIGWFGWYALYSAASTDRETLVGGGGYFGPPATNGSVEIGYSVCSEWSGNGFATEMASALALRAARLPAVHRVIAHTHETNAASIKVLQRSAFQLVSPSDQPDALLFEWTGVSNEMNQR